MPSNANDAPGLVEPGNISHVPVTVDPQVPADKDCSAAWNCGNYDADAEMPVNQVSELGGLSSQFIAALPIYSSHNFREYSIAGLTG